MKDIEKIELAARRNAEAIRKSVWAGERERRFMANAFDAFADEILKIVKSREVEP